MGSALAVWLSPAGKVVFLNACVHGLNLAPLLPESGKPLTWTGFFYGLGGTTATASVGAALLAFFYNRLAACGRAGGT
ncbi:DUF5676 family membrane protein [Immundisolibacter cernigliae]|uniref:Uncharacterized protein n=1 Tax=Immundisolibacter cernigliae TaxID=1810504 RepID=A0A1B1YTH2_9GAMM|nr:DUF5676 family membrane protein [Immundisolibacter cernigliae]ANX03953.1 hypothetical protein PG2T_06935 [Immundisolibacter cernigliae]